MASARYTLQIDPEDLKPDEPRAPLTPKEKWQNFWFYYKWHVVVGVVVLLLVIFMVRDFVSRVEPDLQMSFITSQSLPQAMLDNMSQQLEDAGMVPDINGDGESVLQINLYQLSTDGEESVDYANQMAGTVKLSTDLQVGDSVVFLTDDLESVNEWSGGFSAEEGAQWVDWQDAPGLANLDLTYEDSYTGQTVDISELLEGFVVARRGYSGQEKEEVLEKAAQGDAFFEALTGIPSRW